MQNVYRRGTLRSSIERIFPQIFPGLGQNSMGIDFFFVDLIEDMGQGQEAQSFGVCFGFLFLFAALCVPSVYVGYASFSLALINVYLTSLHIKKERGRDRSQLVVFGLFLECFLYPSFTLQLVLFLFLELFFLFSSDLVHYERISCSFLIG